MKKKKKPTFNVPNSGEGKKGKVRVKDRWRKPRGIDNKKRVKKKSAGALPKIGYKNAKVIRGKHPSGYYEIIVHTPKELENIDKEKFAIRIAAAVGKRKRKEIIEKAKELGIKVLNPGGIA